MLTALFIGISLGLIGGGGSIDCPLKSDHPDFIKNYYWDLPTHVQNNSEE